MRKKLHFISLGCVKNLVDSEVMLGRLKDYEMSALEDADVILVNTCGFIEAAKTESLQTLFDAIKRRKKGALLVASGCLSERYKEQLQREIPEIDIITGVGDYDKIDAMIAQKKGFLSRRVFLADDTNERVISNASIHAYVKISEGCNQHCSFCAIPSFKGRLQSRTLDSVLAEVRNLATRGYVDISFVAQDSSSYLYDKHERDGLCQLIRALDSVPNLRSARILYLYPSSTNAELIETIARSKVIQNYFDMPIQHIADSMLKTMRRGSDAASHKELLNLMRAVPGSFVRTSLIVGHPEESEAEFETLLAFLEDFAFDRVNIFAYSDEEGTKAAKSKHKVAPELVHLRIERLNAVVAKHHKAQLQRLVGREIPIVLDTAQREYEALLRARDMRCAPEIDGEILINESLLGTTPTSGFYRARICEVVGDDLLATLVAPL